MNAPTADRRQFLAGSGLVLGLMLPMRGARAVTPTAIFAPNALPGRERAAYRGFAQ